MRHFWITIILNEKNVFFRFLFLFLNEFKWIHWNRSLNVEFNFLLVLVNVSLLVGRHNNDSNNDSLHLPHNRVISWWCISTANVLYVLSTLWTCFSLNRLVADARWVRFFVDLLLQRTTSSHIKFHFLMNEKENNEAYAEWEMNNGTPNIDRPKKVKEKTFFFGIIFPLRSCA